MPTWFEDIAGPGYANAVMWTLIALVALGVVMLIVRIFRKVSSGTYGSAGNYRARLAVMDAAEVDAQRRLVLVRRDEVEHLIMIGGPTDIVIEQNIIGPGRSVPYQPAQPHEAPRRRHEATSAPAPERAKVEPVAATVEREPRVVAARQPVTPPVPERREPLDEAPAMHTTQTPAVQAVDAPVVKPDTPRVEPAIAQRVAATEPNVDEVMVSEFERDFRKTDEPAPATQRREPSIEDEMDRLLNEAPQERR
ncbi:hypothetical protein GTW25_06305 [Aliihoeflea aestuarii]|jgi:hypothetical protein|uniref:flagellar biosynthetic protein FliO n=1 Tax=Aliihoeflea aestuarii TaxID=453840 RepID=UPI002093B523|nr:flagellar biosynthetic protein FliO [Aliihoeflea aestuarii]MCO6390638.1 hypothetical protein [Aliihoeflea aestuarii]